MDPWVHQERSQEAVHAICRSLPRRLWIHRERSQEAVHAICRSLPRHLWIHRSDHRRPSTRSADRSRGISGSIESDHRRPSTRSADRSEASLDRSRGISGSIGSDHGRPSTRSRDVYRGISGPRPRRLWIDGDRSADASHAIADLSRGVSGSIPIHSWKHPDGSEEAVHAISRSITSHGWISSYDPAPDAHSRRRADQDLRRAGHENIATTMGYVREAENLETRHSIEIAPPSERRHGRRCGPHG
jgi:hypothetical protein